MQKKYVSLSKLSTFLDNLKNTFAALGHKHTINDLTDYTVDTTLSDTSTNPVQNKVIDAEFDSIATAMNALEVAADANLTTAKSYADTGDATTLEAAKAYADEYDIPMFEIAYDSDSKTYSLVDVTFDELNSYALQFKMVMLRYGRIMFWFTRRVTDSDGSVMLYYSQMYSNIHYYFLIKQDGSVTYNLRSMLATSNPTGTGYLSMNRKSGTTKGNYSVAVGYKTTASGSYSHAEGYNTTASATSSHAEGYYTSASGSYSHAEGSSTTASSNFQHVQGKYNVDDANDTYAHIVGNGTYSNSTANYSNAHTLDWAGNAWFAGGVYIGSTSGTNKDDGSKKLATEDYVDEAVASSAQIQLITWEAND